METATVSDRELVEAARRGDAASLGAVLDRHRTALMAVALIILGDRARAEDAVQDAYVVALRRLASLRDPTAVGPWLRTIVRNICRMELRGLREAPGLPPELAGSQTGPEAAVEGLAVSDWVWTALAQLPEEIRTTMMLRHFSRQASYAQIAVVLGIPVGTVRSRLNQGRQYLSTALSATAEARHPDNAVLVRARWRQHSVALDAMARHGDAGIYFEDCVPDVLVSAPASGYQCRGTLGEQRNIADGLGAGVRMRLTRVLASDGVTIIEAEYQNPPEDPQHCPAWHTEIRIHPTGPTTRLILHFGNRF